MFRSNGRATSNGSDSASTSRPASMPSGPASTSVPTPYYMPYYFPAPFMMSGHASATNGAASGASPTEANNPNPPQALGNMMYYMPPPPGYAQGRQQTQQQHPGMQGGYFMVPTPGSSQGIHPSMVLDVRHSVASNTPTASGATKAQHQQQQQAFYAMAPPPAHYPIYGSPYSPQFMVPGHPHLAFGSSNSSCGSLPNSRPASPTLRENKASVKQESNGSSPTSSAMTSAGASAASMMNSTADTISTSTEVSNDSESTYPARTKRAQVKVACVHCKKACKKCDDMRPCQRCYRLGLEDSCVSAPRKPRPNRNTSGPYARPSAVVSSVVNFSPGTYPVAPSVSGPPPVLAPSARSRVKVETMEDESRSGSCTTTVDEASQPWNLSTVSATSAEGDLSSKPSTPSTSPLHSSAKGCILERRWSSDGQQTEENGPAAPGPQKPAHSLAILSLICNQEAATLGTENV